MSFKWLKLPLNRAKIRISRSATSRITLSLSAVTLVSTIGLASYSHSQRKIAMDSSVESSINAQNAMNITGTSFGLSPSQAWSILEGRFGRNVVHSVHEVKAYGYSLPCKVFEICATCEDASTATTYILWAMSPDQSSTTEYKPNTLASFAFVYDTIRSKTSIPLPPLYLTDSTCSRVPYCYALTARPSGVPLSEARGQLSKRQNALIDLRLGSYLQQLHAIENDWFGMPTEVGGEPDDPSYSWQESFTLFLEEMLYEAEARGEDLPFSDIRGWLSRAIGFYLFDDVEVPKLIWFTGREEDIYVDLPSSSSEDEEPRISAFLNLCHALWGDPLLESLFYAPSPALIEGYGAPIITFPRQNTKRLWYTLFWGLVVMKEAAAEESGDDSDQRKRWAADIVKTCLEKLKDAPCY
ncbi:hypothetical protein OE88DRAFT_1811129 [Heliocybe sulcata]|uniref:Aminoglycoside phosphotransferase domain-containing protein n=1 Tax=Heliocybe sulcata TaxID=5364 RepID=A0A5C3MQQ2_9AGAM|nr:hypothetical protein OE88DRAFT_1811129 [Heliocybe sulcata]